MIKNEKCMLEINTSFEGLHCYPDARGSERYLSNEHRHIFYVCVRLSVFHDDRELEFYAVKHYLNFWIQCHCDHSHVWHMGSMSCEQVARDIMRMLDQKYCSEQFKRQICVKVFEDNENGAIIEGEGDGSDGF